MKLRPLTVIGLNSGTSMDGIDAAIFDIRPAAESVCADTYCPELKVEMLAARIHAFKPSLLGRLRNIVAAGNCSLEEICRLDAALGEEFAAAALAIIRANPALSVDLIGSHGQTIWHAPREKQFAGVSCKNSLQLGEAAIIAQQTRIPVYSDFRVQDLAAGGEGAPLVPFADQVLFGSIGSGLAVLNIGGIANITVLKNGKAQMAFDTGPGNMLSDRACQRLFGKEYDLGGAIAASADPDRNWLGNLLMHPYLERHPPKTTGREEFGLPYADTLIDEALGSDLKAEKIVSTLAAFCPAAVVQQYERFIRSGACAVEIQEIVIGGGGLENKFMLKELENRWPHRLKVSSHEDYGISSKFKESLLFALLAYTSHFRIPNNVPLCTGARKQICLGKLSCPF